MVVVTELENTFWGIVLKNKDKYEHKSERSVRLTMASVDHKSIGENEFVPVYIEQGSNKFIICTLKVPNVLQQQLNLELNAGETVNIYTEANAIVHLTGFHVDEPDYEDQQGATNGINNQIQFLNKCEDEFCDEDHDDEDDDDEMSDEDNENGDFDDEEDESNVEGEEDEFDDDEEDEEDDDELDEEQEEVMRQLAEMHANRKRKLDEKESKKEEKKAKNDKQPAKKSKQQNEEEEDALSGLDDESDDEVEKKKPEKNKKQEQQQNKKQQDQTKKIDGVELKDTKVGHGPEAKKGRFVHVYYTGRLKSNGKVFDSCQQGKPFKFRLGSGQVIPGWEIGIQGMKVGGKRTLTIPPNKAYGNKKSGPIPANSTLVFDVELKSVS